MNNYIKDSFEETYLPFFGVTIFLLEEENPRIRR